MIIASELILTPQNVLAIDTSDIENLCIVVTTTSHGDVEVRGIHALEAVMLFKPSALENRRLRWVRHAWSVHNLVGHPLMQVLAWLRMYRAAMWIHDATVPKPVGRRSRKGSAPPSYYRHDHN